jgi:hypothetical protein
MPDLSIGAVECSIREKGDDFPIDDPLNFLAIMCEEEEIGAHFEEGISIFSLEAYVCEIDSWEWYDHTFLPLLSSLDDR